MLLQKVFQTLRKPFTHFISFLIAVDLVSRLLALDPEQRITVDEALRHPFMKALHCPSDEVENPIVCTLLPFFLRCC
jgi:serine/threonine protein kinase